MSLYKQFQQLGIDTAALGFEMRSEAGGYFCTPVGARIFGWAGVDGIHYCFVRGFGEMVFAVNPMALSHKEVHPIARNFEDFLRLVLSCRGTAALEQAHGWSQEQFDQFLRDDLQTPEQSAALQALSDKLSLTPMEAPFAYITALQEEFDRSQMKYPPEYEDIAPERKTPEWKVYFSGGFSGGSRERAGREIAVRHRFVWGNEQWMIPAVYVCGKGLVIDFCAQIEPERIRTFMEKWKLADEEQAADYTDEQRELMEAENPLCINIRPQLSVGNKTFPSRHGSGTVWNPYLPKGEYADEESKRMLEHYGLDPAFGWVFWRVAFPVPKHQKVGLQTLGITLEQETVTIPGVHFRAASPGDTMTFVHPTSGVQHVLTVKSCECQEIPHHSLQGNEWELPTRFMAMQFTLSPDLPDAAFSVIDCSSSDLPKQKAPAGDASDGAASAGSIGIIGGADGPTAVVLLRNPSRGQSHSVCSALHFEWTDNIEWRIAFREKQREGVKTEIAL